MVKQIEKTQAKQQAKTGVEHNSSLEKLNKWCENHLQQIFILSLIICVSFSGLLFDQRVSLTGDDSAYIINAMDFIRDFKFPGFQGPLYPMIISPVVALLGVNVVVLKLLSLFFMTGFFVCYHYAFRNRVPALVHASMLLLLSINSYILYYASQTYNEALYMFILAGLLGYFFRYFVDNDADKSIKTNWKQFLVLASLIFAITLTRSVGYTIIGVFWLYFILRKQWKNLLWTTLALVILIALFQLIKFGIWHKSDAQFASQGNSLLYKNYYNHQEGKEDLAGFAARLVENTQLYMSKHVYMMLGMRDDDPTIPKNTLLTLIALAAFTFSTIQIFKKNRYVLFTAILAFSFCGLSFIALQTAWDQGRLIVPYFPFLLLTLLAGIYYFAKERKGITFLIPPILTLFLFLPTLSRAADHIKAASKITNKYYGLSPDWVNYTKLSEWAGKNLPKDKVVACRKPTISFIYSKGRRFHGLDRVPMWNTQTYMEGLLADTSAVIILSNTQLAVNNRMGILIPQMGKYLQADVITDETLHFIYKIPKENQLQISKLLSDNSVTSHSVSDLQAAVAKTKDTYTIYPDSMLLSLQNRNIGYILSASLRKFSAQKTGETINTVERYMLFVETKYPGIFQRTTQMGENEDEPAWIYEIRYNQFGMK